VIIESKNAKALRGEECVTPLVARFMRIIEMLAAVDFDNELCGVRKEIGDVGAERSLPAEAGAFQPMRTQAVPNDTLGLGQIVAKRSRAQAHFRFHLPGRRVWRSPLPTLPRKRGRGSVWFCPRQRLDI
jgi:hypothetical protein